MSRRRSLALLFTCVLCIAPLSVSAAIDPAAVSLTTTPVSTGTSAPISISACPNFTRTLGRGARGSEVQVLQQHLIAQKLLAADLATGYFGPLTEAAVQQFQTREGVVSSGTPVSTGFGFFGMRTRAALLRLCSQGGAGSSGSSSLLPRSAGSVISAVRPLSCTYTSQARTVHTPSLPATYTADMCRSACDVAHIQTFGLTDLGTCTFVNTNGDITTTSYTYTQATTSTPGTEVPVQIQTQTWVPSTTNVSYPTPACTMFTNTATIGGEEKVTLTWVSSNAVSAEWIPDRQDGTFSIPPPGEVPSPNGTFSFTPSAEVFSGQVVNPGLLLQVTGPGGFATCGVRITVRGA